MDRLTNFLNSYRVPNFFRDIIYFSGGFLFISSVSIIYNFSFYNKVGIYPSVFLNTLLIVLLSYFVGRILDSFSRFSFSLILKLLNFILSDSKLEFSVTKKEIYNYFLEHRNSKPTESIDKAITKAEVEIFIEKNKILADDVERNAYTFLVYNQIFSANLISLFLSFSYPIKIINSHIIFFITLVFLIFIFFQILWLEKSLNKKRREISNIVAYKRRKQQHLLDK